MILIEKKKRINRAMWVMMCPKCGRWCASAAEKAWLPNFAVCDCDEKKEEKAE